MSSSHALGPAAEPPPIRPLPGNERGTTSRLLYYWRAWWPVALGICVIACESTSWMGADHTSGPLRWLFEHLFGPVSDTRWETLHHYIRKTGHFTGYGLIGLAWLRAWRMTLPRLHFFPDAGLAVLGTALISSSDEWHQTFLPDRTGTAWDTLLDCSGAITMNLVVWALLRILRAFHRKGPW